MFSSFSSFSSAVIPWERELAAAIKKGDLVAVISVLSRRDVSDLGRSTWPFELSPMHEAVIWNAPAAVMKHLVGAGIYVDSLRGDDGKSALHLAVFCRKKEVVRTLLDLGADPEVWVHLQTYARTQKFEEIVKILQEYPAKRKTKDAIKLLTAKVESKRKLEEEFAKGAEILKGVDRDEKNLEDLGRELEDLGRELEDLGRKLKIYEKLTKIHEEMTKNVQEEMKMLETSILARKRDPDFPSPSKMKRMRMDLEESCEVYMALEKVVDGAGPARSCPICIMQPKMVFNCVVCNNWFCGQCREKKEIAARCPNCRAEFSKSKNPVRNVAMERLFGI